MADRSDDGDDKIDANLKAWVDRVVDGVPPRMIREIADIIHSADEIVVINKLNSGKTEIGVVQPLSQLLLVRALNAYAEATQQRLDEKDATVAAAVTDIIDKKEA